MGRHPSPEERFQGNPEYAEAGGVIQDCLAKVSSWDPASERAPLMEHLATTGAICMALAGEQDQARQLLAGARAVSGKRIRHRNKPDPFRGNRGEALIRRQGRRRPSAPLGTEGSPTRLKTPRTFFAGRGFPFSANSTDFVGKPLEDGLLNAASDEALNVRHVPAVRDAHQV